MKPNSKCVTICQPLKQQVQNSETQNKPLEIHSPGYCKQQNHMISLFNFWPISYLFEHLFILISRSHQFLDEAKWEIPTQHIWYEQRLLLQ